MFLDLECFDLEQGQNYHRGDFLLLKSVRYTPIAFLPNPCSMSVIATERETFEDEKNKHVVGTQKHVVGTQKHAVRREVWVHCTLVLLPQATNFHF